MAEMLQPEGLMHISSGYLKSVSLPFSVILTRLRYLNEFSFTFIPARSLFSTLMPWKVDKS